MIAFTFPGQGSQKPGVGAAWVDHPSWELVAEASDAAGRDVAALLLDADADTLPRHPQRPALDLRGEPRGARRRGAARRGSHRGGGAQSR